MEAATKGLQQQSIDLLYISPEDGVLLLAIRIAGVRSQEAAGGEEHVVIGLGIHPTNARQHLKAGSLDKPQTEEGNNKGKEQTIR